MLEYRLANEADRKFLVGSWVDSYRTSHAAGMISMDDWDAVMAPQVKKVLARDGVLVHVAYAPAELEGNDLYGWVAVERDYHIPTARKVSGRRVLADAHSPLVHYVFVKQPYRRMGIARGLLRAAGVSTDDEFLYSCRTAVIGKLASQIPKARWAPLVARHPKNKP